jgi:hypothetical protein
MDGGREVEFDSVKNPHLDHGYAVTCHSSQGQTTDRVLIHVDTELRRKTCSTTVWPTFAFHAAHTTRKSSPNDREKLGASLGGIMYRTAAPTRRR